MDFFINIIKNIVAIFKVDEWQKLRAASMQSKEIKRNKYRLFYLTNKREAQPLMGLFFHDVYDCVKPYQKIMMKAEKSQILKEMIFQRFLDDKSNELIMSLSEDAIRKQADLFPLEKLFEQVKANTAALLKYFNESWLSRIDDIYIKMMRFSWFVNFDYVGLLQKFCKGKITAEDMSFIPIKVKGVFISEYIKDFLAVSPIIEEKIEWQQIFNILKQYDEAFPETDQWLKLYPALARVVKSQIFTAITRLQEENPDWEVVQPPLPRGFAADYINAVVGKARRVLSDIEKKIKTGVINDLVQRIFGESSLKTAIFFNESDLAIYVEEGSDGFTSAKQFEYLLSFFFTFCGRIRELANTILIKASWTAREYSSALSHSIYSINECFQELTVFDHSLSEQGERAARLRSYLSKSSRGKRHEETLQKYVDTLNLEAHDLITKTMNAVLMFHKQLSTYYTDKLNNQQAVVRNWSELDIYLKESSITLADSVQKLEDLIILTRYIESTSITADNTW